MERSKYQKGYIQNHQINSSNKNEDEKIFFNLEYLENLRKKREEELNSLILMRTQVNDNFFEKVYINFFLFLTKK